MTMRSLKKLEIVLAAGWLLPGSLAKAQTWTPLIHPAPFSANPPLLLTDGTVMLQDTGTPNWRRLTPDQNGSYINGSWSHRSSTVASYGPQYFAAAVLPDGRVIIEGGEYNLGSQDWTSKGALYDPTTDAWTSMLPPTGWTSIGDGQSIVLANG